MNVHWLIASIKRSGVLLFFAGFVSCNESNAGKINELQGMENILLSNNQSLISSTKTLMNSILSKSYEPATAEKATIWLAKAREINNISDSADNYILKLKRRLNDKADIKLFTKPEDIGEHKDAVAAIFNNENESVLLQQMLLNYYEKRLLNTDEEIRLNFEKTYARVSITNEIKTANDISFNDKSFTEALLILTRIENLIRLNENSMISFCHSKIGSTDGSCGYSRVGVLVGQSTHIVKPGGKIIISAGIGQFSSAARPVISIAGRNIKLIDGQGTYTFKAAANTGIHKVKVMVSFRKEDGTQMMKSENISYEVVSCPKNE